MIMKGVRLEDLSKDYNSFKYLSQLHLDLSQSFIKSLSPAVFEGLSKLESLNLSGNLLTTIISNTFKHLTALKEINLGYNNLKQIEI